MNMKVGSIYNVIFLGNSEKKESPKKNDNKTQIKDLTLVTPDFHVNIPQKYTKIDQIPLGNGLNLHLYKLANGHKVSIIPMADSPAVVKNYVNVGSMNETPNIKGISHFLEHMAFNGTNGENGHLALDVGDSFKKIDELGGWANASTNYAITDYVNSTPLLNKADLEKQIKIIAAMTEDLKLSADMIEKEKHPVCSEINMILDDPQTIAFDQTVRTLFNIKNPADEMVGGSVKHIQNLTRQDILNYYNTYYTPDNMNLVITGDVNPDEAILLVAKNFNSKKVPQGQKYEEKLTPINKSIRKDFTSDKAKSCEIILGFAGPKNNDIREKIIFDLAKSYILSYSGGLTQNLKKYNSYPFIDSEKINTNLQTPRFVYLAANSSEENSEKVLKTIFDSLSTLQKPDNEILNELKQRILTQKEESFEYSSKVNDIIGNALLNHNLEYITDYENILNSITEDDVINGVKKYFNLNKAAITLIHPTKENNEITFKSKREPLNTNLVSEFKLDNDFNIGLYNTKNNNFEYNISLYLDKPYNKKAGVIELLNEMYSMGTASMSEEDFERFQEKHNLNLYASASPSRLKIHSNSSYNDKNTVIENAKELLYAPRLTEENLQCAKNIIRDYLSRAQDSSYRQYVNYNSKVNPYEYSEQEILENLDNITLNDIKDCHNYLLKNSRGIITANIPEEHPEAEQEILRYSAQLKKVLPNNKKPLEIYTPNIKPIVLTNVNNNSQADIMQVHKFKCDNTIKETALAEITNTILTNSSIGLFNTLRERDHLAYSVYSSIEKIGDCGEISCNILTTTDNKEIGEYSYQNVQKSIDGFNNQINELKKGSFTDRDLENAKLSLKANLLNTEGTTAKLKTINTGLNSKEGILYTNKLFNEIDSITKEDITDFAKRIFQNPPIYSIVASKDTIEYNKDYLAALEA